MTLPTPAIVTQSAVRPLPRWALLLLSLAYTVAGFAGRDPWRNADMEAFGYMREIALGHTLWMQPLLAGLSPEQAAPLSWWLGAWAIIALDGWLPAQVAVRVPFAALLVLTLLATWHGMRCLANTSGAQPVAFAFGGEAQPADYARALADAAVLALIACLGLAQLAHETTADAIRLASTALLFFATAALPCQMRVGTIAAAIGLLGLVLSGAPALASLLGLGGAWLVWCDRKAALCVRALASGTLLGLLLTAAATAWALGLWSWRIVGVHDAKEWDSLLRLMLWFTWPAWPLALWTLWCWRRQIASRARHRHLLLPLWFALIPMLVAAVTRSAERTLLLGLPALAVLAAFALPTLRRSMAAAIDWFTLLFFSVCAITIWIVWLAVQTGVPAKPAANVAKLAPGYVPEFSLLAFCVALAATLGWCALVWWRVARNRTVLWKSLVLPAGGTALGWLLLMTLWLPLLNYGRSFAPQVASVSAVLHANAAAMGDADGCVIGYGLSRAQVAALAFHAGLDMAEPARQHSCTWAVADALVRPAVHTALSPLQWRVVGSAVRPTDRAGSERFLILQRMGGVSEAPEDF